MPAFEPVGSGVPCPQYLEAKPASHEIQSGVWDDMGRFLRLKQKVGNGVSGEGDVFLDQQGCCIKIFRHHVDTTKKREKLISLIQAAAQLRKNHSILAEQAAFPVSVVYADRERRIPAGYRMRYLRGYLPLVCINSRRNNTGLADRMRLTASLTELAASAEAENLILADVLSQQNVLYDPHTFRAALIDTDSTSFTRGGILFGCTAGREELCSPEHIGGSLLYPRTAADDAWSLQVLLFYILAGCEPYIMPGSSATFEDAVRGGMYSFPVDAGNMAGDIPAYMHQWAALPHKIQRAFYSAFSAKGAAFTAGKRRTAAFWKALIRQYPIR